jgi:hypothetical protein
MRSTSHPGTQDTKPENPKPETGNPPTAYLPWHRWRMAIASSSSTWTKFS